MNREFLGEYDKAIKEFIISLTLDHKNLSVYKTLIRLNKKSRKYQDALDYAKDACEKFPHNAFIFAQTADLYRILKEYELAIEKYTSAISIDDNCIPYYQYRAQIKYYINDVQGAINDYTGAILRDKKSYDLYSQRGFYEFEQKNYQSAVDDYTQAIKLKPDKAHLYYMRSCAYKLLNNEEAAEKDNEKYKEYAQVN